MKSIVGAVLLIAVLVAVFRGSNHDSSSKSSPPPRAGNPAVYQRIARETNCVTLQTEFTTADAAGNPDYMVAANNRMHKIGCFDNASS